ncbi:MAG TPA: GDSL-type esterase/lipase family protein [Bacteroidales bacterium]|nr:GDSL-type esterase/lipase family protein [Bacteroidales bacterium]
MHKKILWVLLLISILINFILIAWIATSYLKKSTKQVLSSNSREELSKDIFNYCPNDTNEIIFLGNSITAGFKVDELFPAENVKNRGIWGDQTRDMLNRIGEIIESKPKKLFILAGINDIIRDVPLKNTVHNIELIILEIQKTSPETKIYIQSILPLTRHASNYFFDNEETAFRKIVEANKEINRLCNLRNVEFISIDGPFLKNNELNEIYSWDGIHLNGKGYMLWYKQIERFVVD